jgi:restriction system protein
MSFPLRRLFESQLPPLCIRQEQTVREALELMLRHDFNQLPVVDQQGTLKGMISEQTILRTYFHSAGKVSLLDLQVYHCQEAAVALALDEDLIHALDLLNDRNIYAIVVVEGDIPVGVLTHYGVTRFFREVAEGQFYVENIELTLRSYIESVLAEESSLQEALFNAFGPNRYDKTKPARDYGHMGFYDHIRLITDDDNWPRFEAFLAPKALFTALMEQARLTRNQVAHYRGRPDALQYDGLKVAMTWLAMCPPPPPTLKPPLPRADVTPSESAEEGDTPIEEATAAPSPAA